MKLLIALLLATQAVSQELNSTLYSTLYGIQVAFVDEMIEFTCVVGGSSMAWTSIEYIGEGQQLIILSGDPPGVPTPAVDNPQTVAELISATSSGIVTRLRIRVASTFPIASVQCQDSTANTMISTTFQLAGAALITCDRVTVCPGETVTCACATGNSNSLTWITDGNRVQFSSSDPLLMMENVGSSTSAVLTENSDRNGVRVIMSNITVGVSTSSTDPLVTLTCENDGAMVQPIILPIPESCPMIQPTDQVTTATSAGGETQRDSCSRIAAAVLVPLMILIHLGISVIGLVWLFIFMYKPLRKQCDDKVKEINELKEENEVLKQEKARHIEEINVLKEEKEVLKKEKARYEDTIQNLQALLLEREKQLRDKVGELKKLNEQGGANRDAILKLQTETRDKDATIRTQKRDLDANAKTIQRMTEQLEKVKTAAAAELKKKVNSIKEEHMAALELMEKNMKKRQQDAFKALKETVVHIKVIKERTSGETSADPEKDKVKDSKQAFETLKDKMKESIDTTSSDLEKILEEEINKILEDKKGDTPSKKSSSRGLFSLGKHK